MGVELVLGIGAVREQDGYSIRCMPVCLWDYTTWHSCVFLIFWPCALNYTYTNATRYNCCRGEGLTRKMAPSRNAPVPEMV